MHAIVPLQCYSQNKVIDRVTFSVDSFPTKPKNYTKHVYLDGEIYYKWHNEGIEYRGT